MKRLLLWAVLSGVAQSPAAFAQVPSVPAGGAPVAAGAQIGISADAGEFRGLGKDRENLSPELIALRSERLEATTNVYLLRFAQAAGAPSSIFGPGIWTHIQTAAEANDIDPMVLAGMIFIESFGDPMAKSPTGPAGIAQLTKASAKEMGLIVGKKVPVGTQEVTKKRTVGRGKNRRTITETKKVTVYRTIDERYDPDRAIMAMARRLSSRRAWLGGRLDFAIAEYHMGAGRMQKLLSAYFGRKIKYGDMPSVMKTSGLTYPALFWTNTPYFRPEVYKQIEQLNRVDFSPTYYFRVRQAMRLLELHKTSPAKYASLAASYRGRFGQTAAANVQWSFVDDNRVEELSLKRARDIEAELGQRIVALPTIAGTHGIRALKTATMPLAAERSTIGCLLFVADQLEKLQGKRYTGFETSSMVRALDATDSAGAGSSRSKARDDASLPMHTLGWAFDLTRKPLSKDTVRDLTFILTDLRLAGLLTFAEEGKPKDFHVVRHPDYAPRFEKFYWDAVAVPQQATSNAGDAELR